MRHARAAPSHPHAAALAASPGGETAFDGKPRKEELLLMEGYPSLNPLAPRLYVDGFAGGVWMRYELPATDVRVRISSISGEMCVLSAIAFDEV